MTDEHAAEPLPRPPDQLLVFLRAVEAAGDKVEEDLRVKARIWLDSFKSGQWPVVGGPQTAGEMASVSAGAGGSRAYTVQLADAALAVDSITVVRLIPAEVPPTVRTFLHRLVDRADAMGMGVAAGLLTEVVVRAPEWIGWVGH